MLMTSMPPWVRPAISAPTSSGELKRPSRPTASRVAPLIGRSAIFAEDLTHCRCHVGARERKGDIGLQEPHLVAAIEALPVEAETVERLVAADQLLQRVGELDLVAGAAADAREMIEHLGLQDVAADDAEIGR